MYIDTYTRIHELSTILQPTTSTIPIIVTTSTNKQHKKQFIVSFLVQMHIGIN